MSFQDADGGRYSGRSRAQWGQTYQAGGGAAYRPTPSSYMGAPAQDFERLYQIVANNIKLINQNVNQIATMVKTMGNPSKDSHDLRIKLRDMIEDTRRSAADTNKSLKDLSHAQTTNPQEDKRRTSKLRNDFQSCLERFQDISKVAANKTNETFAPKPSKGGLLSNPAPFIDETEDEQHGLMQAQKRQQLMQLDADRDFQSALIEEREEGIKQIESTIQEVNDIFVDLATLVNEQAGMVDNIESHIDSTVSNTAKGVVELRKAASYQEAARTKMCCLVVIILAVVAVVVVALVLGISLSLR